MKNASMIAALALVVAAGLGCGGTAAGFSCESGTGASKICIEYNTAVAGFSSAALTTACAASGGTAGTGCSRAGSPGGCQLAAGSVVQTTSWYYGTLADAQLACSVVSGTFVTP